LHWVAVSGRVDVMFVVMTGVGSFFLPIVAWLADAIPWPAWLPGWLADSPPRRAEAANKPAP
jgi:hypothetical protein